jgi:hypothetical protein
VLKTMSAETRDGIIISMWEDAHTNAERKNLTTEMKMELVRRVSERCSLDLLTFDALRKRVTRIQDRGALQRAPGSGRQRIFNDEHADFARDVARSLGGDISRSAIFEATSARFGQENMNKRTQFLRWLVDMFKRRRIRYIPTLTDEQKRLRVAYAQHCLATDFSDENRTIFVTKSGLKSIRLGCTLAN